MPISFAERAEDLGKSPTFLSERGHSKGKGNSKYKDREILRIYFYPNCYLHFWRFAWSDMKMRSKPVCNYMVCSC